MTARNHHIKAELSRWLERLQVPRRLEGNDENMATFAAKLIRLTERSLPNDGYTDLLADALDSYEEGEGGHRWPSMSEWAAALSGAMQAAGVKAPEWKPDRVQIAADRINAGDAVSEYWLFGGPSQQLLRHGVSKDRLDQYRQAAFQARGEAYSQEAAEAWAAEIKSKHAAGIEAERQERQDFATGHILDRVTGRTKVKMPKLEWEDAA